MPHPYKSFPERNFWSAQVSSKPWEQVFEGERGKFTIQRSDRVVTAGSCFAQRISEVLTQLGYGFAQFEPPHALLSAQQAEQLGYGRFSARYGNIYTPRQLFQLMQEALELRPAIERFRTNAQGRVLDLMRPNINALGFDSVQEARQDRLYHLSCVQKMLRQADVFIFTLGLTEAWMDRSDGVVHGVHPAVALRQDSDLQLQAVNFDYTECYNDMVQVIHLLHGINPALRYIFTVSPVALAATHQDQHVLLATSYSKSVLRAVAGKLVSAWPMADYFHSFEIFNAAQSFGQFLAEDLRDVNMRGVQLAMKNFEKMFLTSEEPAPTAAGATLTAAQQPHVSEPSVDWAQVECDEVANAAVLKT